MRLPAYEDFTLQSLIGPTGFFCCTMAPTNMIPKQHYQSTRLGGMLFLPTDLLRNSKHDT
jgi:hypothetical protein